MQTMKIYPKQLSGIDKLEYLLHNYNKLFNDNDMKFVRINDLLYSVGGRDDVHLTEIFDNLNKEMDKFGSIRRNN